MFRNQFVVVLARRSRNQRTPLFPPFASLQLDNFLLGKINHYQIDAPSKSLIVKIKLSSMKKHVKKKKYPCRQKNQKKCFLAMHPSTLGLIKP